MNPKQISLKIGLAAGLIIITISQASFPQKTSQDKLLAEFERRIERSDLAGLDRPLADIVIADPSNTRPLELLARLRLRQGRLAESKALYQRVLLIDPALAGANINSARIAVTMGNKDEATRYLNRIADSSALSPHLKMELAAAYLLIDEPQRALEITETLPVTFRNTTGLPLIGEIYLRLNRSDLFTGLIPQMKKACPKSAALAVECAKVLRDARRYKVGIELLNALPATAQNNVTVLLTLGRLELLVEDFTRAREHLNRTARLAPNSAEVLSAQAYLESVTGSADTALKLMTRARELAPNSTTVLADFVALTLRVGKPTLAFDAASTLATLEPANPEFQYLFGVASLQSGNLDRAQETLAGYVQRNPADFRGCLALGMVFAAQRGKIESARDQLSRCTEIDPANTEARYQLGLLYKSQGENSQAIAHLEEVVNRSPKYSAALRELGALYLESGDDSKAHGFLVRAVSISPKDADTHFQLIRLYNRIGEKTLAKQHSEIFQKLRGPWGKSTQ